MKTLVFVLSLAAAPPAILAASGALQIEAVEGDNAIHNVRGRQFTQPSVRVTDHAGQPVEGAVVTFLLPGVGAGATFAAGSSLSVLTDSQGLAQGRGMKPNTQAGAWEIRVAASYQGKTAQLDLPQINAVPLETASVSGKTRRTLLLSLLAGGAAAGLAVTLGRSGQNAPPPATGLGVTSSPPTLIVPGSASIGGQ